MHGFWLIDEDVARNMTEARRLNMRPAAPDQIRAWEDFSKAEASGDSGGIPRIMKLARGNADIRIEGALTKSPDFWSFFFGGGNATYTSIISSLAIAAADPDVKTIRLLVDSPGGNVDGLFETLAAIEQVRAMPNKKLSVFASNALSAAYGISAAAGTIEAASQGSRFGSIGVAVRAINYGDVVVDITNTDSPDKRPNVATEEGRAVVRRELDAIHELFVDTIARGRGVKDKEVREGFGRGASFVAGDAKKRGMIDSVARPALRSVNSAAASSSPQEAKTNNTKAQSADQAGGRTTMDLRELRAQHPALYDELFEAGRKKGSEEERDRVGAHLTWGQAGGEEGMKLATKHIKEGTGVSLTLGAEYQTLALNRADRGRRQTDDQTAASAVDGANQEIQASSGGAATAGGANTAPGSRRAAAPIDVVATGQEDPNRDIKTNPYTTEELGAITARRMMEKRGKAWGKEGGARGNAAT